MNTPKRVWDTNKQRFSCFEWLSRVDVVQSSPGVQFPENSHYPVPLGLPCKDDSWGVRFVFMKDSPGSVMELSTDVWNTCANISS